MTAERYEDQTGEAFAEELLGSADEWGFESPFSSEGLAASDEAAYPTGRTATEGLGPEGFAPQVFAAEVESLGSEGFEPEGFEPEYFEPEGFAAEAYGPEGYTEESFGSEGFGAEQYTLAAEQPQYFGDQSFEPGEYAAEGFGPEGFGPEGYAGEGFGGPVFEAEGFPSGVVLSAVAGAVGRGQEHWDPHNTGLPLLETGPAVRRQRLSAHFTVGELVTSGGRAADKARISPGLVRLLQGIRERAGKPVRINSGYRSWARNEAVYKGRGQTPTLSRHCSGQAADIVIAGLTGTQIAQLAIDAGGTELGIGVGSNYAHVDVRGSWALWTYLKGAADAQAREAVTAHRARRQSSPAPAPPPPSPTPTPTPQPTPSPLSGPAGEAATRTPDRLKGVVTRPRHVGPCTGSESPGAQALAAQWRRLTGLRTDIYNCRPVRGHQVPSVHGEGRAIDIYADAGTPRERAWMDHYVAWLIANAVELQVVYIIWNRRQWGWPQRHKGDRGWRAYQGERPHTDHAHVELSWEGARHPSPLFAAGVPGLDGNPAPPPAPGPPTSPVPAPPASPSPTPPPPGPVPASGVKLTPKEFIARYGSHARASQAATGVPALVTLAQAALESGWGEKAAGFNFFGIKARATDPPATRQLWRTREVLRTPDAKGFPEIISVTRRPDGRYDYIVRDWFRVFPDAASAFIGHGEFLRKNRRYANVFRFTSDPYAFAAEVAKAGYATDPSYSRVLASVMTSVEKAGWTA